MTMGLPCDREGYDLRMTPCPKCGSRGCPELHRHGGKCSADKPTAPPMSPHTDPGEMLPCPFCGGTNIQALEHLDWVACNDCGASLEDCEPSARELWNRRQAASQGSAGDEPINDEMIERAIDAHEELFDSGDAVGAMRAALEAAFGVAQAPSKEETFCHWLKGYLGAIKGRDELDAREANVVRNKLNEMLDGTSPIPSAEGK